VPLDVPRALGADQKGILPDRMIAALTKAGGILPAYAFAPDQIQPASLDLRLGDIAYRVRASFLPGHTTVAERIEHLKLHEIALGDGAVLETGCVYIVPLLESLALPPDLAAAANPKSSTGRLDVFTRVITDRARGFDRIEAGYHGPLYAEISPKTFPVLVREGSRLSQLRLRRGHAALDAAALADLHARERLVDSDDADFDGGISVSVDLAASGPGTLIGYRAKRHTAVIDIERRAGYDVAEFWEPMHARPDGALILDPDEFYILASKEAVQVPPDHAAEMVPFDPLMGEFRVHYAGFFDPGFGYAGAGGKGSRAVLEVRSREVPFILEHGQLVGRLVYEKMIAQPDTLYGTGIGSNYQAQGLKLSKHFRA
jgi:dCTP deaminase